MAGNRKEIMEIKQIIALKAKGYSNRKIAREASVSRNTVDKYVRLFKGQKLSFNELRAYDEAKLLELLPNESEVDKERYEALSENFSHYLKELKKPGCTLLTLWHQYIERSPKGYRRSQFNFHFNQWRKKVKGSCKLEHLAGQKLYVDYTGKKLEVIDKESGEICKMEVFVAILPCSQYTFVTASKSQSKEDFIDALEQCLHFMEGVPLAIVTDNLKSAVTKTHKYAPKINQTLQDFALHYGCVIDPTRPYSPQDKALVEGAVKLVYQRIFYPMNEQTFFSLNSLNQEITERLVIYNNLQFNQSTATRKSDFLSLEKEHLQFLPSDKYEVKEFRKAKVQKIGHIYLSDDQHYYSVPYRFIGKQTDVHYTTKTVAVFYKKDRIAFHKRDIRPRKYSTTKEHLSSTHRAYSDWSLAYFQKRALFIGEHTCQYITDLIEGKPYPEIAYKQAMGILSFRKNYSSERVENACLRGSYHDKRNYHIIENILKKGLDKAPLEVDQTGDIHIPEHQNIRANFH